MGLTVGSLFSGIGGFELGFDRERFDLAYSAEIDPGCNAVLSAHFPDTENLHDILTLKALDTVDILTAGFPCQSFSQAGKTLGLKDRNGKLLAQLLRLLRSMNPLPEWLVFENVPFILSVGKGAAVRLILDEIEGLGYRWAYRIIDCRTFGTPQRRRRWILVATRNGDPSFLFEAPVLVHSPSAPAGAYGFYWTEGNTGLGWATDAIPPLKVGSAYGIPSTPAFWEVQTGNFATPTLEDSERLQGFPSHWTSVAGLKRGQRLRMIGNAVNPLLSEWIAEGIKTQPVSRVAATYSSDEPKWSSAALGDRFSRHYVKLSELVNPTQSAPLLGFLKDRPHRLSAKAAGGFLRRARQSSLRFERGFLDALAQYVDKQEKSSITA